MILELSFIGHIGGRVDAGKGSEVVDEMGLVEIAAAQSDFRPIDALAAADYVTQDLLETLNAAEKLGCQSDLLGEELNEAPFAQPDLIGHARDGTIRQAAEIADGKLNGGVRRLRTFGNSIEQRALENIEFRLRGFGREQLLAQEAGFGTPQRVERHVLVLQLVGGQLEQRKGATRLQHRTDRGALLGGVDDRELRIRADN